MHKPINKCFCTIVPPIMLEKMVENGDKATKKAAINTLIQVERMRSRRDIIGRLPSFSSVGVKSRTVYDAGHQERLPGSRVRGETDPPTGDQDVNNVFDACGHTFDFYKEVFDRVSLDGNGKKLDNTVHYGNNFGNAFFDGNQMVYGDGDGQMFSSFTKSVDVIAHELTHGVVQYTANLVYQGEPGANNEHMADAFGSMVKQKLLGHDAQQADWLIGQGLLSPGVKGVALRSMLSPGTAYDDPVLGKDIQPATWSGYQALKPRIGQQDNGGVHIFSGVPNFAFARACIEIGGPSWVKIGPVWYKTLTERLTSNSDFHHLATSTYKVAVEMYGTGSLEAKAVQMGWKKAEIDV